MGFLSRLLGRLRPRPSGAASLLQVPGAHTPTWTGGVYDAPLTWGAIDAFARACCKLRPVVSGSAKPAVRRALSWRPNPFQTTSQFLYQVATIYKATTTCVIVPIYDERMRVAGFWPATPAAQAFVTPGGRVWVRATMPDGETGYWPLEEVGIMRSHQLSNPLAGDGSGPLEGVLEQVAAVDGSMVSASRNGSAITYIAKVNGQVDDEDLKKVRKTFADINFGEGNQTSLAIYDARLESLERVEPKDWVADANQMGLVRGQVFDAMGTNEEILQASYDEGGWTAYYESQVEPFAIQLGEVLTCMAFTELERSTGNAVEFRSNRLQYATVDSINSLVSNMVDRGVMSVEQGESLLGIDHDEGGTYVIRGEYVGLDQLGSRVGAPGEAGDEGSGDADQDR